MRTCLNIIRWIIAFLLSILLFVFITVGIPLASITKITSNSDSLKQWLIKGNLYDSVSTISLEIYKENVNKSVTNGIKIDELDLLESFDKIFPSDWIKGNIEKVIDAFYLWFDGQTSAPEFTIPIEERKNVFIEESASMVLNLIDDMPVCSKGNDVLIMKGEKTPFDLNCKPSDFIKEKYIEDAKKSVEESLNQNEMLKSSEIKSNEYLKLDPSITINVQTVYKIYKIVPTIVMFGIGILSVLIFLFIPGFSNKFLNIGLVWVLAGSLQMIGIYFSNVSFDSFFTSQVSRLQGFDNEFVIDIVKRIVKAIVFDIQSQVRQYALVFVVLGIVFVIGGIILKFSKKRMYIVEENEDRNLPDENRKKPKDQRSEKVNPTLVSNNNIKNYHKEEAESSGVDVNLG